MIACYIFGSLIVQMGWICVWPWNWALKQGWHGRRRQICKITLNFQLSHGYLERHAELILSDERVWFRFDSQHGSSIDADMFCSSIYLGLNATRLDFCTLNLIHLNMTRNIALESLSMYTHTLKVLYKNLISKGNVKCSVIISIQMGVNRLVVRSITDSHITSCSQQSHTQI